MTGKRGNPALVKGGKSLNPAGRPKGSKNAMTELQNHLIEQFSGELKKDFRAVLKSVIKKAKEGDIQAAKLLFDRAIPARKAVEHYGAQEGIGGINIFISETTDDDLNSRRGVTVEQEVEDGDFDEDDDED